MSTRSFAHCHSCEIVFFSLSCSLCKVKGRKSGVSGQLNRLRSEEFFFFHHLMRIRKAILTIVQASRINFNVFSRRGCSSR